jgi:formylglycine-generating enzyme required for sulfatase activity/dienelactone hydrolase
MDKPFAAYSGDARYAFVSYSHADAEKVYADLIRLQDHAINVWYDEGISPGHNWPEELANAIENSSLFIFYVSPNSVKSPHCLRETSYAVSHNIPVLAIHLAQTELPKGLELEIGNSQAIFKWEHTDDHFIDRVSHTVANFSGQDVTSTQSQELPVKSARPPEKRGSNLRYAIGAFFALLVLVFWFAFDSQQESDSPSPQTATADAIVHFSDVQQDLSDGEHFAAFRKVFGKQTDLTEAQFIEFIRPGEFKADPAGAVVSIRELTRSPGEWLDLGTTPTGVIPLPLGSFEVKIEAQGYQTLQFALTNPSFTLGNYFGRSLNSPVVPLSKPGTHEDMVYVPAGRFVPGISGFSIGELGLVETGAFYMDKHEVRNRDYKQFVDAGGYDNPEYWQDLTFDLDGEPIPFEQARNRFVDSTGRYGPATWELSTYPPGEENHPVTGVSWYEAKAYARYSGKALPNIYHWARAAYSSYGGGPMGGGYTLPPQMAVTSNFDGKGAAEVGAYNSIGAYGTYDQAGNAREWIDNRIDLGGQWLVGGGWDDFSYMGSLTNGADRMNRHETNGFRLSLPIDDVAENLLQPYQSTARHPDDYEPVSDDVYRVITQQFSKSSLPLDPRVVGEPVSLGQANWRQISLRTGEADGRFTLHIVDPPGGQSKGTVVVFPGIGEFMSDAPVNQYLMEYLSFVTIDGRTLVMPEFRGSFTRYPGAHRAFWLEQSGFEDWLTSWHNELARTLDYLEAEPQTFGEQFTYMGVSYGAAAALPLLALEERLQGAVLIIGGVSVRVPLDVNDSVNYLPRIKLPVLYMAATLDPLFPVETGQKPLLKLIGTPADQLRYVQYEGGHIGPPRQLLLTETTNFLDGLQRASP